MSNDNTPVKVEHRLLNLMQTRYPGFHPAMVLADIAHKSEDEKMRMDAAKSLMPYVSPQLKSLEVRGEVKHDHGLLRVSVKPTKEEKEPIDITPIDEDDTDGRTMLNIVGINK